MELLKRIWELIDAIAYGITRNGRDEILPRQENDDDCKERTQDQ